VNFLANILKDVTVDEVSLVTKPAINRKFLLYKSMDVDNMAKLEKEMKDEDEETTEDESEETDEEQETEDEEGTEAHGKNSKKVKKGIDSMENENVIVYESEVNALITKALTEKDAEIAALKKAAEDEKTRLQKDFETVNKALEIEKSIRITKEFVDIAKADMPSLVGTTPDKFGLVLKEMSEKLSKETYTAVVDVLKTSSAFIEKSNGLTKEFGTSAVPSGSSHEKLAGIANSYISKDSSMTYAKAFLKAYGENPELAKQYDVEYKNGGA
jgi:hypothetical protein